MAYCRNCGAYVPDGQNKCLACGFEEPGQAEKKPENGSAAGRASNFRKSCAAAGRKTTGSGPRRSTPGGRLSRPDRRPRGPEPRHGSSSGRPMRPGSSSAMSSRPVTAGRAFIHISAPVPG